MNVWRGVGRGMVLVPIITWEMGVPDMVIAGALGRRVVSPMGKPVGFKV